jgi:hypothetical protein
LYLPIEARDMKKIRTDLLMQTMVRNSPQESNQGKIIAGTIRNEERKFFKQLQGELRDYWNRNPTSFIILVRAGLTLTFQDGI